MAKSRGADVILDQLSALKGKPASAEARQQLVDALAHRVSFIVAKAADLGREMRLADLCPDLQRAFARYLNDPRLADKGCAAKTALARAALELQCPAEPLFRAGIRHVQREGSFGAPIDVAAELRGLCALGLVQVRYRDVMNELVDLLVDPEAQARTGSIRALAMTGREDAALLLRLRAALGERDSDVLGECLTALLQLAPAQTLEFTARFLEDSKPHDVRDVAALALGSSRQAAALAILTRHYHAHIEPGFRGTLMIAIASLRIPEAQQFLIGLVASEPPTVAGEALKALRIFRNDAAIRQRLGAIVAKRGDSALQAKYQEEFTA